MKILIKALVLFCLVIYFCSCKKEKANPDFKWFTNGTTFTYDLYTNSGVQKNFEGLMVRQQSGYFYLSEDYNILTDSLYFEQVEGQYIVKSDGLYSVTPKECEPEMMIYAESLNIFAPNSPKVGQQIPFYNCGSVAYNITISAINQSVTVPYGTFNTYVMQYQHGCKGYWDPNVGLIMFEIYDNKTNLTDTLKLNDVTKQ